MQEDIEFVFLERRLKMSLISSRVNDKQATVKVDSRKRKRGGRHNKDIAAVDDIYDFINLRYRDDIERYRRGKTVSE